MQKITRTPIPTTLARMAALQPDVACITCNGRTVTRREFDRMSNRVARAYAGLGVRQGDFVTVGLPNSIDWYVATMAIWKLGATPQPISHKLPRIERDAILSLVQPSLIVGRQEGDPVAIPGVPAGFTPDDEQDDSPLPVLIAPSWRAPTSGGSTGRPKIIVISQDSELPLNLGSFYGMHRDDVHLVTGPLYHNSSFTFSNLALLKGAHLVVLERFDTERALDSIAEYEVTLLNLVPTMMLRIWRALQERGRARDLASLRRVWHMAAPCPPWLKHSWIDLIGAENLWELYGGTEGIATTAISGTEWLVHPGSVGRPVAGEVAIFDGDGRTVPAGQVGEIFMRPTPGAPRTYRYIGAEPREHNGYESIGDMGYIDDDGYLYLSDRRTDMILSGGANIYPAEVEAAFSDHPAVLSCVVIGLPDEDRGNIVHAVVQARPGTKPEDLLAHVSERLARYKVPRSLEFTTESLRDATGKVRRQEVREKAIARRLPA